MVQKAPAVIVASSVSIINISRKFSQLILFLEKELITGRENIHKYIKR